MKKIKEKKREKIIEMLLKGYKQKDIAEELNISQSTVSLINRKFIKEKEAYGHLSKVHSKPLDVYIPNEDEFKDYIHRDIDNKLDAILEANKMALLVGETGTGKTYACRYYAYKHNLPCLIISLDDNSKFNHLLGFREIRNNETTFEAGLMVDFLQNPSLILFDEINALPAKAAFRFHEMTENRSLFIPELRKTVKIHPECRIAFACNQKNMRYIGTNNFNAAFLDRLIIIKFPHFTDKELSTKFKIEDDILRFYIEAVKMINRNEMRTMYSIRTIKQYQSLRDIGFSKKEAFEIAFVNKAMLNEEDEAMKKLQTLLLKEEEKEKKKKVEKTIDKLKDYYKEMKKDIIIEDDWWRWLVGELPKESAITTKIRTIK